MQGHVYTTMVNEKCAAAGLRRSWQDFSAWKGEAKHTALKRTLRSLQVRGKDLAKRILLRNWQQTASNELSRLKNTTAVSIRNGLSNGRGDWGSCAEGMQTQIEDSRKRKRRTQSVVQHFSRVQLALESVDSDEEEAVDAALATLCSEEEAEVDVQAATNMVPLDAPISNRDSCIANFISENNSTWLRYSVLQVSNTGLGSGKQPSQHKPYSTAEVARVMCGQEVVFESAHSSKIEFKIHVNKKKGIEIWSTGPGGNQRVELFLDNRRLSKIKKKLDDGCEVWEFEADLSPVFGLRSRNKANSAWSSVTTSYDRPKAATAFRRYTVILNEQKTLKGDTGVDLEADLCKRSSALSDAFNAGNTTAWEEHFPANTNHDQPLEDNEVPIAVTSLSYLTADLSYLTAVLSCLIADLSYLTADLSYLTADLSYLTADLSYLTAACAHSLCGLSCLVLPFS